MEQPVHLHELSSAARHAKHMKKEEFIHFATEAFNMSDLRHQNICGLAVSANNNNAHDIANKNESTDDDGSHEMSFIVNENNR